MTSHRTPKVTRYRGLGPVLSRTKRNPGKPCTATQHGPTCWLILLAAATLTGCVSNHYTVEMKPRGSTMQRELTCWRQGVGSDPPTELPLPADELKRIATVYQNSVSSDGAGRRKFVGEFAHTLPDDVGGNGSYTYWSTPLGSASTYIERFRGNDDLIADVEKRRMATDRLADLLMGWLTSELKGKEGFDELHKFLDHQLRRDLANISMYVWASETSAGRGDADGTESLARVGQYLLERSYFTVDELPAWVRAAQEAERTAHQRNCWNGYSGYWLRRWASPRTSRSQAVCSSSPTSMPCDAR